MYLRLTAVILKNMYPRLTTVMRCWKTLSFKEKRPNLKSNAITWLILLNALQLVESFNLQKKVCVMGYGCEIYLFSKY